MPDIPALLDLAQGLGRQGRTDEAEAAARQAIALDPASPDSHVALGSLLRIAGRLPAAEVAYREALRLRPGYPSALFGLAKLLRSDGRLPEARVLFEQVLRISPTLPVLMQARLNLPVIYSSTAEIALERQRYVAALGMAERLSGAFDPESQFANSSFNLAYHGEDNRPIMEQLGRLIAAKAPGLNATADHLRDWSPPAGRRIKVAFVSMLLRDHTIGRLNQGLIAGLDRRRFEVVVAHLPRAGRDAVRAEISAAADLAIDLPAGVRAQRERLAAEQPDVVFYPDVGMSPESYLLAQARLAPVQAVSWGHPDTTGLPTLDYFVSSDLIEGEGAEDFYTERLIRLPRLPCVYAEPPAVEPLTRAQAGLPPTGALYGCPQSLFKLHPDFDAVLAEIVARDPQGWLVFIESERLADHRVLQARWAERHPEIAARAVFLPRAPRGRFLGVLGLMDVLLDPPHFGSGNTVYEAIGLGVPVVTWPGRFMRGRIVAGAYRQIGLEDPPVVERLEDYAGLAVALARDPERLGRMRARIREKAPELFQDVRALSGFEAFLDAAVAAAGRGETLARGWKPPP